VREGGVYKVIPDGEGIGSGRVDRGRQVEPGYGLSVLPLRYVSAQTILRAVESFAAKPGMVRADPSRNWLLIQGASTERATTIQAAMALDVDWMKGQSVGVFPVRNASPETIIAELQNVFDSGREGSAGSLVRFQAITRLNAVLAIAQTPGKIQEVRSWVSRLDRADYDNTTVRVYRVRFGNARVMAGILREVFTGQGAGQIGLPGADISQLTPGTTPQRATSQAPSFFQQQPQQQQQSQRTSNDEENADQPQQRQATRQPEVPTLSGTGGPPLLPGVRITADVANNSLLIYANRDQYKLIERAIFELDRAPLQVAIDATIAEITLKDELQYGVQFFLRSRDNPRGSISFGTSEVLQRAIPGFNLVLGRGQNPQVVINALRQLTDVKVLSSPALVVLDNQQATLQVGDEVPMATQTSQAVVTPGAPIVSSIERRNTGVILRVTPRVNANGVVTLDVIQEISNVVGPAQPTLTPTISQRKIQSSIAIASGQTVLLGGLISSRNQRTKTGLPIISDIKVLGDLLSQNTGTEERTELIIFIRPQIIRDGLDAQLVAEELRAKLSMIGRSAAGARPSVVAPVAVPRR
jgi:general secretion pathway protein D